MDLSNHSLLRREAFIGGHWREALGGRRFDVVDPASGVVIGSVPDMEATDAERAIEAAAAAFPAWARTTAVERGRHLRCWHDAIVAATSDLAAIITAEGGKPLAEARSEVNYAAGFLDWFAEEARRGYGEVIPPPDPDRRLLVLRQPVGVAAAITPWNFPGAMILRKAAAALAAGCSLVVKPAPQTPLTALALAALAEEAGLPPGVLNVVTGSVESSRAIGAAVCASPTVRALSFTGSTAAGIQLAQQAAMTVKKVSLELGGNAPCIVFDDADLEAAVAGAIAAKFRHAGQTCVCVNRFFLQAGIHDTFVERFAAVVAGLRVGPGSEPGVMVGPLIDARAVAKVSMLVADAVACGGRTVLGGRTHARGGSFFEPTLITGCGSEMRLANEEIFGPVAAVFRFDTESEVIARANATESGLAAYLFTRDVSRCFRVAEALECGMVGINTGLLSTPVAPFGGTKASGLGREGGRHGMDEFQELKYICFGGMA
jgi:succinate-semialdehyde dehydrogenase/glutarate-semialdehyde dehydrogenase